VFSITFLKKNVWLILIISAILYVVLVIRNDLIQNSNLKSERDKLEAGVKSEALRKEELKESLKDLNSKQYIGRVAREKLGYVEQGERAYKVIIK
jgi:cell division protein FtsB